MSMRQRFIPYAHQLIEDDDIAAVVDVLRSEWLTTGPKIREFEAAFAQCVGARYAVAVSSGTAALHAAAFTAGIGPGDEVITTPLTFAATANCILYQGGIPVFADIDPQTYTINPDEIARKITPRTKAIIPVHYAGQPCDLERIHEIAKEHGLVVIEDAAHALGALYRGRPVGSLSDLTIFSFHPVKHITTGEGGMVTTNSPSLYERLLMFRSHGITRDTVQWQDPAPGWAAWYYEMHFLGYNYRMSDIHAALGISQLKKADRFLARRREIVSLYHRAFTDLPGIVIPCEAPGVRSAWHLYVIQVGDNAGISRDELCQRLRAAQIGVNLHYIPVYRHPFYLDWASQVGRCLDPEDFPHTEDYYRRALTLPLFPAMTDEDVDRVIVSVTEALPSWDNRLVGKVQ